VSISGSFIYSVNDVFEELDINHRGMGSKWSNDRHFSGSNNVVWHFTFSILVQFWISDNCFYCYFFCHKTCQT